MKIQRNRLISALAIIIVTVAVAIVIKSKKGESYNPASIEVRSGDFRVTVTTTGELEAKNSVKILGPRNLRKARVWNIKINDIIEEGSEVQKGDYIAQLDRTDVAEAIKNKELDLEKSLLELNQAKIDTAIELQKARNNLENLKSTMHEKKLELEKSAYEPPVIIKQAEVTYQRACRDLDQAKEEYKLNLNKTISKVRSASIKYMKTKKDLDLLQLVLNELTIYAPEDGLLIYHKDRNGEKFSKGSNITAFEPIVAELPDLNHLISKTFVNEVDIRKVKLNQKVEVIFDAFPDKMIFGKVISIANVGETIQGGKARVFRVDVQLDETDRDIKPGMTTGNTIISFHTDHALYLPIETVYSQGDSLYYVYKRKKLDLLKQEVIVGERNDQDIVIVEGLTENDKVLYTPPKNSMDLEFSFLDSHNKISHK